MVDDRSQHPLETQWLSTYYRTSIHVSEREIAVHKMVSCHDRGLLGNLTEAFLLCQ
jgi:hypothetical protein